MGGPASGAKDDLSNEVADGGAEPGVAASSVGTRFDLTLGGGLRGGPVNSAAEDARGGGDVGVDMGTLLPVGAPAATLLGREGGGGGGGAGVAGAPALNTISYETMSEVIIVAYLFINPTF